MNPSWIFFAAVTVYVVLSIFSRGKRNSKRVPRVVLETLLLKNFQQKSDLHYLV